MAIEPGCVPATAIEAVSAGMIRAAVPSFASSNLARARRHGLSLAMPHRVAYLPFGAIHPHLDLRQSTHMRSWRFLVLEAQAADSENGAAVEGAFAPIAAVTAVAADDGHEFGDLNEGPVVAGTDEAIRRAEKLEQVRNGRFEACILMIPSLYVVALWLQDRGGYGNSDIFLAIPPSHSDLRPFKPMHSVEFVTTLNRLAVDTAADPSGRSRGYLAGTRPSRVQKRRPSAPRSSLNQDHARLR